MTTSTFASAVLTSDGVMIAVTASGWDGTANELLDQYNTLRDRSSGDDNTRLTDREASPVRHAVSEGTPEGFTFEHRMS